MEERYERLRDLLSNETTAKELIPLPAEEASTLLCEKYGIRFSTEELISIMQGIRDSAGNEDELSEADLDTVAGGGKGSESYEFGKSVGRATPAAVALVCAVIIVTHIW